MRVCPPCRTSHPPASQAPASQAPTSHHPSSQPPSSGASRCSTHHVYTCVCMCVCLCSRQLKLLLLRLLIKKTFRKVSSIVIVHAKLRCKLTLTRPNSFQLAQTRFNLPKLASTYPNSPKLAATRLNLHELAPTRSNYINKLRKCIDIHKLRKCIKWVRTYARVRTHGHLWNTAKMRFCVLCMSTCVTAFALWRLAVIHIKPTG